MSKKGRPLKPFKGWTGWKDEVLDMYSQGASDVEVRVLIAKKCDNLEYLSNDLWYRWLDDEEIFSETINMGKELSKAWWSREGRVSLRDKDFSYTGWYMNMKNRFGWSDKQQVDHTSKGGRVQFGLAQMMDGSDNTD